MDIGNFLQFESAFQCNGILNSPADIKKIEIGRVDFGDFFDMLLRCLRTIPIASGNLGQVFRLKAAGFWGKGTSESWQDKGSQAKEPPIGW